MRPGTAPVSRFESAATSLLRAGRGRQASVLIAVCALLYFGSLATRPFHTRGEPREGLVVQRLVEGGGSWLVPERAAGELARKPPLYYWLAGAVARAAGRVSEWSLRLPSAVLATAGVLGTAAAGRALWGAPEGFLAAAILATTFEWTRAASNARVDMTFAALLGLGLIAGAVALASPRPCALGRWAFYGGVALATLSKGPLGLAVAALAVAGAGLADPQRARERLRPAVGLLVVVAAVGAWLGPALVRAGSRLARVLAVENFGHLLATRAAATGHAHSAAYLLGLVAAGCLPWTPLLVLAALRRQRLARGTLGFLLGWAGGGLALLALASAKRGVYALPLYPAFALLLAGAVTAAEDARCGLPLARLLGGGYTVALLAVALLAAVLPAAWRGAAALPRLGQAVAVPEVQAVLGALCGHRGLLGISALASTLVAVPMIRAARRERWAPFVLAVAATTTLWSATFTNIAYPALGRARSLKPFLSKVNRLLPPGSHLYAYGRPTPAMRFYAHRPLGEFPPAGPAGLPEHSFLLVWERDWPRARPHVGVRNAVPLAVSAVEGAGNRGHLLLLATDTPAPHSARSRS